MWRAWPARSLGRCGWPPIAVFASSPPARTGRCNATNGPGVFYGEMRGFPFPGRPGRELDEPLLDMLLTGGRSLRMPGPAACGGGNVRRFPGRCLARCPPINPTEACLAFYPPQCQACCRAGSGSGRAGRRRGACRSGARPDPGSCLSHDQRVGTTPRAQRAPGRLPAVRRVRARQDTRPRPRGVRRVAEAGRGRRKCGHDQRPPRGDLASQPVTGQPPIGQRESRRHGESPRQRKTEVPARRSAIITRAAELALVRSL